MTGGGDTDEFEAIPDAPEIEAETDDDERSEPQIELNTNDRIPRAGAADIGGRAGGDDDR